MGRIVALYMREIELVLVSHDGYTMKMKNMKKCSYLSFAIATVIFVTIIALAFAIATVIFITIVSLAFALTTIIFVTVIALAFALL